MLSSTVGTHAIVPEQSCTNSVFGNLELINWNDDTEQSIRAVFQPTVKLVATSASVWLYWNVFNMSRGITSLGLQPCLNLQEPEFCFSILPNDDYFVVVSIYDDPNPSVLDKPLAVFHVYLRHPAGEATEANAILNNSLEFGLMDDDDVSFTNETRNCNYWMGRQNLSSDGEDLMYPLAPAPSTPSTPSTPPSAPPAPPNDKGKEEMY